jgi:cystathionine beta-lyase/cystathionine gamma-synthase
LESDLNFILNHLGEDRENYFHAIAPPIIQTSNFALPNLVEFRKAFLNEFEHHLYTRGNNPTVEILRKKLAALEGTEDCLVFASGSGAIAAAVIGQVSAGDHIVCVNKPYSWTQQLLNKFLARFGVSHTYVDGRDLQAIRDAIRPNTRVLYLESPNSLTFELQDLAACAAIAKEHGLTSIIDNSYCSPLYQNPAKLGIDVVVHSGTKYLNGHSDVVVGVVCGSSAMIQKLFRSELMTLGGILGPHDAGLVIRGLRTLPLRLARSNESAWKIVHRLSNHPKVESVIHPFHESFGQLELAKKQMRGCGGLFAATFRTDTIEKMEAFIHRLNRFAMAVSWGGHESLILPTVGFYNMPGRNPPPLPYQFVRFYIGLEEADWLWEDVEQAMEEL